MEKDILGIIENNTTLEFEDDIHDIKVSAKEIASHMTKFTGWLRENADIGNYVWDIGDGEEYSDKGIYQYWKENILKTQ